MADRDPKYKMLGDTYKLIGNSIFGKSILAKEKLFSHIFCFEEEADKYVRSNKFRNLHEIGHNVCEIEQTRKTIKQNMPIVLGFTILNYAKLSLLQFYYDFIKKYIPDHRMTVMETDTDSLYLALSKDSLISCIPNKQLHSFLEEQRKWMPVTACDKHYAKYMEHIETGIKWSPDECCQKAYTFNSRSPGKWKIEAEGNEMICLNSKTYILKNEETAKKKISTKGVSKTQNNFEIDHFQSVLETQKSISGVNKGIKTTKAKNLFTYNQTKTALSYLYIKRRVLQDGINTEPLNK